ncbi:hypothetical protein C8A03DRAFT_30487 [Achaetomium macrosporum]|uniref:Uncharacterized protein n=1 Tax=Achaetomium macrosporum TaxID=79813 RepID=A0AAN7CGW6_9PEZI|nr:hypothetical protein C8A03DRAFT_30487 [Achaetomium macrosporum]
MAGPPICPCGACFDSAPQYYVPIQLQKKSSQQSTPPSAYHAKRGGIGYGIASLGVFGRKLRRSRSIESTTSTLVGLTADAQPMGVSDKTE